MERWKKIPEYDYKASTLGRVKNIKTNHILKGKLTKDGYKSVQLNRKELLIHRIIAKIFIVNNENKPQVNHIDGDKTNNIINNLEWCTQSENQKHAFKNNLQLGYKPTKLSIDEMSEMCEAHATGIFTYTRIAKHLNMSISAVRRIIIGETNGFKTRTETSSRRSCTNNR